MSESQNTSLEQRQRGEKINMMSLKLQVEAVFGVSAFVVIASYDAV